MRWMALIGIGLIGGLLAVFLSETDSGRSVRAGSSAIGWSGYSGRGDAQTVDTDMSAADKLKIKSIDNSIGWSERRSRRLDTSGTPEQLARQRGWIDALNVYWELPGTLGSPRFERHLRRALQQAENPVARQNVIFLIALTVSWERAEPLLRGIAADGSDADREDALVALAFSGEEEEIAWFRSFARTPDREPARRLVAYLDDADEIAAQGTDAARSFLRSYRAIEVLDRDPYFDRSVLRANWEWTEHPGDADRVTDALLPAWLDRYPGHPGSDDMAWRLGVRARDKSKFGDALRWFSRGTVLPDQMRTTEIMFDLIRVAERHATPELLDRVANDEGFDTANRELLQYIRIRRIAAERSVEDGLRLMHALARSEPGTALARAWRQRFSVRPPRGLDSGLKPLPADDPLRRVVSAPEKLTKAKRLTRYVYLARERTEEQKLRPPRNPLSLSGPLLARQFRIWETLAELQRRPRDADTLYKVAAVQYHERDAFFPVYLVHDRNAASIVGSWSWGREDHSDWSRDHVGTLRALELFRRIERDFPQYAGMDKVLYSQGLALRRIQDSGVLGGMSDWSWDPKKFRIDEANALVDVFERCASRFPNSDLAANARGAANWWRWRIQDARRG